MRLWTLHPKYLDPRGLVALWREALLAQAVLQGKTQGYRHHPQLQRFREHPEPIGAIGTYLEEVYEEAKHRGYRFDSYKINSARNGIKITETEGQLGYEWQHLAEKLYRRNRSFWVRVSAVEKPESHPMFSIAPGDIRDWERSV